MAEFSDSSVDSYQEDHTDLQILIECLKCHLNNPSALKEALLGLAAACASRVSAKKFVGDCGGLELVLNIAKSHTNAGTKDAALFCLGSALENNEPHKKRFSTVSVFDFLHQCLSSALSQNGRRLIMTTTFCILALVSNNGTGQATVRKSGCLAVLMDIYKTHLPTDDAKSDSKEDVPSSAIWLSVTTTLMTCVNNPQNDDNQKDCGLVFPYALKCLQDCDRPEYLRPTASLIGLALANNSYNKAMLLKCNGADTIMRLYHRTMNRIEQNDFLTLAIDLTKLIDSCLTDFGSAAAEFGDQGLVEACLRLLTNDQLDDGMRLQVCLTLGHAVDSCAENRGRFMAENGLHTLVCLLTGSENAEILTAVKYILQFCNAHDAGVQPRSPMTRTSRILTNHHTTDQTDDTPPANINDSGRTIDYTDCCTEGPRPLGRCGPGDVTREYPSLEDDPMESVSMVEERRIMEAEKNREDSVCTSLQSSKISVILDRLGQIQQRLDKMERQVQNTSLMNATVRQCASCSVLPNVDEIESMKKDIASLKSTVCEDDGFAKPKNEPLDVQANRSPKVDLIDVATVVPSTGTKEPGVGDTTESSPLPEKDDPVWKEGVHFGSIRRSGRLRPMQLPVSRRKDMTRQVLVSLLKKKAVESECEESRVVLSKSRENVRQTRSKARPITSSSSENENRHESNTTSESDQVQSESDDQVFRRPRPVRRTPKAVSKRKKLMTPTRFMRKVRDPFGRFGSPNYRFRMDDFKNNKWKVDLDSCSQIGAATPNWTNSEVMGYASRMSRSESDNQTDEEPKPKCSKITTTEDLNLRLSGSDSGPSAVRNERPPVSDSGHSSDEQVIPRRRSYIHKELVSMKDGSPVSDIYAFRTRSRANSPTHSMCSTMSGRRSRVPYSKTEEQNLIKGLARYGKQWRLILLKYEFKPNRTHVDLKDKYKSMRRAGRIPDSSESSELERDPLEQFDLRPLNDSEQRRLYYGHQRFGTDFSRILAEYQFSRGRTAFDLERALPEVRKVFEKDGTEGECA